VCIRWTGCARSIHVVLIRCHFQLFLLWERTHFFRSCSLLEAIQVIMSGPSWQGRTLKKWGQKAERGEQGWILIILVFPSCSQWCSHVQYVFPRMFPMCCLRVFPKAPGKGKCGRACFYVTECPVFQKYWWWPNQVAPSGKKNSGPSSPSLIIRSMKKPVLCGYIVFDIS